MKNADLPAMPQERELWVEGIGRCPTEATGLTKREMFAMGAMKGILSGNNLDDLILSSAVKDRRLTDWIGGLSYKIADAMLSCGDENEL